MKSAIVPAFTLGLAICIGLLFVQRHHYEALYQRQDRAIALVQAKYDALLQEKQIARRSVENRSLAQTAQQQARTLAPRYASLNRITGYSKKTAQK